MNRYMCTNKYGTLIPGQVLVNCHYSIKWCQSRTSPLTMLKTSNLAYITWMSNVMYWIWFMINPCKDGHVSCLKYLQFSVVTWKDYKVEQVCPVMPCWSARKLLLVLYTVWLHQCVNAFPYLVLAHKLLYFCGFWVDVIPILCYCMTL